MKSIFSLRLFQLLEQMCPLAFRHQLLIVLIFLLNYSSYSHIQLDKDIDPQAWEFDYEEAVECNNFLVFG